MADRIRAACFGAPGSHTDEAMRAWFGAQPVRAEYMDTFEDVVRAVAERRAERGIVPIEIHPPAASRRCTISSAPMTAP